jgi:predicted RNA-binding protein
MLVRPQVPACANIVHEVVIMCEANAYVIKDGKEELFLEALDTVEPEDGSLRLTNIYGEQKFIKGKITRLSLVDHRVIIEQGDE